MSRIQSLFFVALIGIMVIASMMLGNWSEQINPDGIAPHPVADGETVVEPNTPRDAYSFGVSMGLLGCALAYSCLACGMLISARSKRQKTGRFAYWVGGLAGMAFVLSYLIDDYFY